MGLDGATGSGIGFMGLYGATSLALSELMSCLVQGVVE